VVALQALYKTYADFVFESEKLHVDKYCTASQMFLNAWLSDPKVTAIAHKLIKTARQDEPTLRKCYRGGRIHIGQAQWRSELMAQVAEEAQRLYEEEVDMGCDKEAMPTHKITKELYEKILDYLVYLGMNHLC
jgi:hypothetical protein